MPLPQERSDIVRRNCIVIVLCFPENIFLDFIEIHSCKILQYTYKLKKNKKLTSSEIVVCNMRQGKRQKSKFINNVNDEHQ